MTKEAFTPTMQTVFKSAVASMLEGVNASNVIIDSIDETTTAARALLLEEQQHGRGLQASTGIAIKFRIVVPADQATQLSTSLAKAVSTEPSAGTGTAGGSAGGGLLGGGGGLLATMATVAKEMEEKGEIPAGSSSTVSTTLATVTVKIVALETAQSTGEVVVVVEGGEVVVPLDADTADSPAVLIVIIASAVVLLMAMAGYTFRTKPVDSGAKVSKSAKIYMDSPGVTPPDTDTAVPAAASSSSINQAAEDDDAADAGDAVVSDDSDDDGDWPNILGPGGMSDGPLLGPPSWMLNNPDVRGSPTSKLPSDLPDIFDGLPGTPTRISPRPTSAASSNGTASTPGGAPAASPETKLRPLVGPGTGIKRGISGGVDSTTGLPLDPLQ
jgi:hypothetical protein